MKLFDCNLPYSLTESELCAFWRSGWRIGCGPQSTGRSKGFGFAEMADRSAGRQVMEGLNSRECKHRALVCNEAKPPAKKAGVVDEAPISSAH